MLQQDKMRGRSEGRRSPKIGKDIDVAAIEQVLQCQANTLIQRVGVCWEL